MHRFWLNPGEWTRPESILAPEEAHHLAVVLRLEAGARVGVLDGQGRNGTARVASISRHKVVLILESEDRHPAPAVAITLFQAVPKSQKMDWIIQKATELNVTNIIPVLTQRVVVALSAAESVQRRQRWEQIARNAAKQCGAAWLPAIGTSVPIGRLTPLLREQDVFWFGALSGQAIPLAQVVVAARARVPRRLGIMIGPEGDMTAEETAMLVAAGGIPVSFGPRTLRTETAALFALSVLNYEFLASSARVG